MGMLNGETICVRVMFSGSVARDGVQRHLDVDRLLGRERRHQRWQADGGRHRLLHGRVGRELEAVRRHEAALLVELLLREALLEPLHPGGRLARFDLAVAPDRLQRHQERRQDRRRHDEDEHEPLEAALPGLLVP
jgi:hypothetical protein